MIFNKSVRCVIRPKCVLYTHAQVGARGENKMFDKERPRSKEHARTHARTHTQTRADYMICPVML